MSTNYPIGIGPCTECAAPALARKHRTVRASVHAVDEGGRAVPTGHHLERTWVFCSDRCRDAWWSSASGSHHLASTGQVVQDDERQFFRAAILEAEQRAREGYENRVVEVVDGEEVERFVQVPPSSDVEAAVAAYRSELRFLRVAVVDREPGGAAQGMPFASAVLVGDEHFEDEGALEAWWTSP